MKSRTLRVLVVVSCVLVLSLGGALAAVYWWPKSGGDGGPPDVSGPISEGMDIARSDVPNPPPPPKPVANLDRVRQNLKPGKTYVTHTRGTLHVRGEDKDWVFKEVVTINYAFEALIDRDIESNDGATIVELRHFRDVRSLKVDCRLEDVRIELGAAGDILLAGIAILKPEAAPVAAGVIWALDGASLKTAIGALRWSGASPEQLVGLDQSVKAFTMVDRLTGKSVRLTYEDGKGVLRLQAVKGDMTPDERDYHLASVLVSDSLIFPNIDVKVGDTWSVDGANLAALADPSLRARTSGEITLERRPNHLVQDKRCAELRLVGGQIRFEDFDPKIGNIGNFSPAGAMYFSPEDQVIIEARLQGKARLERFSRNHLLFESRMRRLPELEILYTCRVIDTPRKN